MWVGGKYQKNIVEDESAYFQYGQFDELDFYTFATIAP